MSIRLDTPDDESSVLSWQPEESIAHVTQENIVLESALRHVLALTACLAAGAAQAADQGPRHHPKSRYDTATYTVVEGDELIVIGERFEVPVSALKAQNKLASDEVKVGQKLVVAASSAGPANTAAGKRPNIVMLMTDDTGWNDEPPSAALFPGRRRDALRAARGHPR
ncbi:MAG: LysM peptidoglycan-binding domain-containing protein [Candidatus Competibacter sp.]|nr:LysM peptidoglycan-binding domain-containing protein [Candidatus Competibacter sp.]